MPKVYPDYLGLSFYLYFEDHPPPHIHVKYGEYEVSIDIEECRLIEGYLPNSKRKLALEIIEQNKEEFIKKFNELSNKIG